MKTAFASAVLLMSLAFPAQAGTIAVTDGYARAMLPGAKVGGGYLTIMNTGEQADRLTGATSPVAGRVEIHSMKTENGVMTMRAEQGGIEVPSGGTVRLEPGGMHLMFMDVTKPFAAGDAVPLTLHLEKAGDVKAELPIGAPNATEPPRMN